MSIGQENTGNRLLFLGTAGGSADSAEFVKSKGTVGHADSSVLLNGTTLIDCSMTALTALERSKVNPAKIQRLFLTHSHEDHFDSAAIAELSNLTEQPLEVYANTPVLKKITGRIVPHALEPGMKFEAGEWTVSALPANHGLPDPEEQALHYLFVNETGTLLYALDGAWIMTPAWRILREHKIDVVVWDATTADPLDWRSFEHNTLDMLIPQRAVLMQAGVFTEQTHYLLSHRARRLWPEGNARAEAAGFLCAEDDMEFEFGKGIFSRKK